MLFRSPARPPARATAATLAATLAVMLVAALAGAVGPARAQAGLEPQPIAPIALAEVLARPAAARPSVPRTRGRLALAGQTLAIAEYRVLIDAAGELPATPRDGRLLGRPVTGDEAVLAYRSLPDLATLQALVDRGFADLQERLKAAGIDPSAGDDLADELGHLYAATQPGSTAAAPVFVEARAGDTLRRYLVLAPTGMTLAVPAPGPGNAGNAEVRARHKAERAEPLSVALAVNLSALPDAAARRERYRSAAAGESLSPLLELRPAPGVPLLWAPVQGEAVELDEAVVLATEFGRLRAAEPRAAPKPGVPAAADAVGGALDRLVANVGKALGVGAAGGGGAAAAARPRVEAELELDGEPAARLLLYAFAAANQAVVDAVKAAGGSTVARP